MFTQEVIIKLAWKGEYKIIPSPGNGLNRAQRMERMYLVRTRVAMGGEQDEGQIL